MSESLIDMKERLTEFLGIPISPSLKSRLQKQAILEGRSDASVGRRALVAYLNAQEKEQPDAQ